MSDITLSHFVNFCLILELPTNISIIHYSGTTHKIAILVKTKENTHKQLRISIKSQTRQKQTRAIFCGKYMKMIFIETIKTCIQSVNYKNLMERDFTVMLRFPSIYPGGHFMDWMIKLID